MRDGAGDQGQSRDKGQNRVETPPPCLSAVKWSGPSQEARSQEDRNSRARQAGSSAAEGKGRRVVQHSRDEKFLLPEAATGLTPGASEAETSPQWSLRGPCAWH